MAALQERNGSYRVIFRYNGKQFAFTVGSVSRGEADAKAAQVDYLFLRLKQRLLILPEGADVVTFVEHDGKPPNTGRPSIPSKPRKAVTLGHLRDRYLETHGNWTIEANSLNTCRTHLSHFCRIFGEGQTVGEISVARLQDYVNRRSKDKIRPVTIRKELATLRAAWNWGRSFELTKGDFPNKGLRYPKGDEKPPFMTREQVLRQIEAGGEADVLWGALYLDTKEIGELLAHVQTTAPYPWIYPMFCFAAHTGARRSEIIRALVADVDLESSVVTIREKKRVRSERTSRRVPLTPFLKEVLADWLTVHPGGIHLFCHVGEVERSKKRSRTTGHMSGIDRPSKLGDRLATVKRRNAPGMCALTRNEIHHDVKSVLKASKREVLRGLHALRHSFISACASKGVDQRLVQEWCGHMNEQTSRRYRHLWPSIQEAAIKSVFG